MSEENRKLIKNNEMSAADPQAILQDDGSVSKTIPIDGGQFRQYFCRDGISSATSADGLNWTDDQGIRIKQSSGETICDPSPVKIDNEWLMFYKVAPAQNMPQNP